MNAANAGASPPPPDLRGVTLACIDTANHALALRALALSGRSLAFGRTLFLTDAIPRGVDVPAPVEVQAIAPLASRDAYSRFVLKSLLAHVETPHVLLIQWDGYVVNPAAFEPAFLECDYIGAKWFWYDDGMRVGNGGFSLRSRKLLVALQDPRIQLGDAEDTTIGRTFRPLLEREHGIRYASEAIADRFAFEAAYPTGMPFGFHGLYNFCRVVPERELAALAPQFSDAIARSLQLGQLVRNCIALGQATAAVALARRRLAASPDDAETKALLARAEAALASGPIVGRNDPCPCGSGKRYKQCHGALGAVAPARGQPARGQPTRGQPTRAQEAAQSALALAQQGVAAHRRGDVESAERAYRAALRADPDQPLALHYLGVVLFQRLEFADALPMIERSVQLVPREPEFHNNHGLVLAALDRNDEAVAAYRRVLELAPGHATACNNLGLALQALNRLPESIDAYRRALAAVPSFAHAHWNLSLALLAAGRYAEGWDEYEWRLRLPELGGREPALPAPRWDGGDLPGGTLLLTAEQGIGDAVQFVRFARALAERRMRVIVQAPLSLCPLLATAPGVAAAVATGTATPGCDVALPLLSLGKVLGVDASTIDGTPYLCADPVRRQTVMPRVAAFAGGKRRAGLAWSGAPQHLNDRRRSIAPSLLVPLLGLPGIAWFSLQKGPREEAIATVPGSSAIARLDPATALADTAALIDTLDVVVTVDTSIAHIACALGKRTFVMLPFAPDWRWGVAGERTPWYASARLFRQPSVGDWPTVISDVARALGDLCTSEAVTSNPAADR
jgi:tetratricopeptide (TPR) repeat protein